MRRSSLGLHLVLHCQTLEAERQHWRDVSLIPMICNDHALAERMERALREGDCVHLSGYIAPCRRAQIPELKRDWDLVVTGGRIPHLRNWLHRRLTRD